MTITDAICQIVEDLIDEAAEVYKDNLTEIYCDNDVLEITECCLKIIFKRGFLKRDEEKAESLLNEIDWKKKTKEYIKEYIQEHYD